MSVNSDGSAQAVREFKFTVNSVSDTHALAGLMARSLQGGEIVGRSGPLGSGKTEFVRGLAAAFGVVGQVTSPTFVLEAVYDFSDNERFRALHHWDLYRLNRDASIEELSEYGGDCERLVVVEWPERVSQVKDLLTFQIMLGFPGFSAPGNRSASFEYESQAREISFLGVAPGKLRSALLNYRVGE